MDTQQYHGVDYSSFEVIGFDGTVLVDCGTGLPIVGDATTNRFAMFDVDAPNGPMRNWYTREQLVSFAKEGRLTFLESPQRFDLHPTHRDRVRPVVMYVSDQFRDTAVSAGCSGDIEWHRVLDAHPTVWATCMDESQAYEWMDSRAQQLSQQADDALVQPKGWTRAQLLVDMALCAAREPKLRWELYVRLALTQLLSPNPERVLVTYEYIVERRFRSATWDYFINQVRRHYDILMFRARYSQSALSRWPDLGFQDKGPPGLDITLPTIQNTKRLGDENGKSPITSKASA